MTTGASIFIDGRLRRADRAEPVLEAATGEPLGDGASATAAEVDEAVAAARAALLASGVYFIALSALRRPSNS